MNYEIIIILLLVAICSFLLWRHFNQASSISPDLFTKLQELNDVQQKLSGSMTEISSQNRAQFQNLQDKLTTQDKNIIEKINRQAYDGEKLMGDVKERLAKILTAQERIDSLSDSVLDLKNILDNKQRRGLFGEMRLNEQITDSLPQSIYQFQAKLSNGKIADCLLQLPDYPGGALVIDAKFPLEAFRKFNDAQTDDDVKTTRKQFAVDVKKHIDDISEKYLIIGETADIAIMFIPSETVYSEIHQYLPGTIEYSNKKRVYLASPTTLMALLTTIRAILRDAEMRTQALQIRNEIIKIGEDIERLDERVGNLANSYDKMGKNIKEIQTSSSKITKRSRDIGQMEISENSDEKNVENSLPSPSEQIAHESTS